ncbi:hypothetical protein [Aquamicrobium zhengzhouense]|uniref:Uncharacterized protein n=1 Tax=Aquamicrobium zhengzhouense TaxID=2781738 RepID=A0ABS0SHC5_9HYPH|nr:hypothetical protein [Aquamicrobium zhengzhouense]MBI1622699.1 hypothetical protein [Aquamicrobium zhengzhouense]
MRRHVGTARDPGGAGADELWPGLYACRHELVHRPDVALVMAKPPLP